MPGILQAWVPKPYLPRSLLAVSLIGKQFRITSLDSSFRRHTLGYSVALLPPLGTGWKGLHATA